MDCNGISTKIPAWHFKQQALKASINVQGELVVCLLAVLRCAAQRESKKDLEGEDKQLMWDKTEQGEVSAGIQKKRLYNKKESCKKNIFIKASEKILRY